MKRWMALMMSIVMCLTLAACSGEEEKSQSASGKSSSGDEDGVVECAHTWVEATCDTPKTCSDCEQVEGEALGHAFSEPTCTDAAVCSRCGAEGNAALKHKFSEGSCTEPKTCERCGLEDGDPVHQWENATCSEPKTCLICETTEGKPLSHSTSAATCTSPAKCRRCGATQGAALGHDFAAATCTTAKKCSRCKETEGSPLGHDYVEGTCSRCGAVDKNYVKTYKAGETWTVAGQFEFRIDAVYAHTLCDDNYDNDIGATTSAIIKYTYKNLGSGKLLVDKWAFEVYDAQGTGGDTLYFTIWCDHGTEPQNVIKGGSCTAKLPVALINSGSFMTIYVEINGHTQTFKINMGEPTEEDKADMVEYSRVKGEFTYKYNDFVGTRGDNGAKVLFIPKNTALKSQDNNDAAMLFEGKYDNGIIVKKCDGYGRFDTGLDYIEAGEYVVVVVSKNTKSSGQQTASSLRPYLGQYLSDDDLETLALFIGFSKCAIDDLTLEPGYEHSISHDFGITYF